jgi:hypothetical protein
VKLYPIEPNGSQWKKINLKKFWLNFDYFSNLSGDAIKLAKEIHEKYANIFHTYYSEKNFGYYSGE